PVRWYSVLQEDPIVNQVIMSYCAELHGVAEADSTRTQEKTVIANSRVARFISVAPENRRAPATGLESRGAIWWHSGCTQALFFWRREKGRRLREFGKSSSCTTMF